jgi:hypothetical protein
VIRSFALALALCRAARAQEPQPQQDAAQPLPSFAELEAAGANLPIVRKASVAAT